MISLLLVALLGAESAPPKALPNDNRVAAGRLSGGVLALDLEARQVSWFPEQDPAVAIPVYAFAEAGKRATVPAPMIRVPAGTTIRATVRNTLPKPMRLNGLGDSVPIGPGETRELTFRAGPPGTYYYWARTESVPANGLPGILVDAPLLGAFIVDSAGALPPRNERVLVIGVWSDTAAALGTKSEHADRVLRREMVPRNRWLVATVNGLSWPHTERLDYTVGDSVRWRIINGSRYPHPMHLHGFYFDVTARGDARRDTAFTADARRRAVTEWMLPGATMTMSWVPTRPGNWLYHCHIVTHISDATRVGPAPRAANGHAKHLESGMAGLVMALRVAPAKGMMQRAEPAPRRKLRLFVTERANVYGDRPGYSYVLQEGATPPAPDSIRRPSSTLSLVRNQPTEITVINASRDMATIHWHGLELESFYDGVGDWSGWGRRVAPAIAPGDSFLVRLTPPRAGTFIYHTHTDEGERLASGLYGALIVLPEDAAPDPSDRVFLLGIDGPLDDARPVINGAVTPPPIEVTDGVAHKFRFINISPLESHTIRLVSGDSLRPWRVLAKDGADLPAGQSAPQPGVLILHPGETYDVEVVARRTDRLALRVISAETIAGRAAFLARAKPGEPLPRVVVDIPIAVR